jgi:hypothetical protein
VAKVAQQSGEVIEGVSELWICYLLTEQYHGE